MIESISLHIKIELSSALECDVIFDALKYETHYSPNERAKAELKKIDDKSMELIISAQDPVSARAALNSYLRWLNLAQEITEINLCR